MVMKQHFSRNQRAKGFKLKCALQICVLVAICIWLLYQVKHSHDKKKELDEKNPRVVTKVGDTQFEIFDFGRKGLPRLEMDSVNEIHGEEEEHEAVDEVDKQNKQEETDAGGDEIDELDQETVDEEANRGEELAEEEDRDAALEPLKLLDSAAREVREESFGGDDASRTVFEDAQKMESETGESISEMIEKKELEISGSNDSKDNNSNGGLGEIEILLNRKVTQNQEQLQMDRKEIEADDSKENDSRVAQGESETMSNGNFATNSTADEKGNLGFKLNEILEKPLSNSKIGEADGQIETQNDHDAVELSENQREPDMNITAATVSKSRIETQKKQDVIVLSENQSKPEMNSAAANLSEGQIETQNTTEIATLDSTKDQNATVGASTNDNSNSHITNSEILIAEQIEKFDGVAGLEEAIAKEQSDVFGATSKEGRAFQGESSNSSNDSDHLIASNIQNEMKDRRGVPAE